MLKSDKEYAKIRSKLASWRQLRKRVNGLGRSFSISTDKVEDFIEEEILQVAQELQQFESFCFRDPDGPDGPFALLEKLRFISTALICARTSLGWTQAELAAATNLKRQQISRYENSNYQKITLPTLLLIARTLVAARKAKRERDARD